MFWEIVKNKDFFTSLMELLLKIFSPFGGKEFPIGLEGGREMKAGPCQSYIFQVLKNMNTSGTHKGGFQLLDLIIPELKSHVIPYKFKCSHWWKIHL